MNDSREQEINNLINSLTTNNEVNNNVQNIDLINSLTTPNSNTNPLPEQNMVVNQNTAYIEQSPIPNENVMMQQEAYNNMPQDNVMMQQETYNNMAQDNVMMQQEAYNNMSQDNVMTQETYNNMTQENVMMQQEAYNNMQQNNVMTQEAYNNMQQNNVMTQETYNNMTQENVMMQDAYNNMTQENVMTQETYNNMQQNNVMMQEAYNNIPQDNVMVQDAYNNIPQDSPIEQNVAETPVQNIDASNQETTNNNLVQENHKPKTAVGNNPKEIHSNLDRDFGDTLISAYVGKNYEKISTKKFNFAAFFLTAFYLFYRKSFLLGVLFLVGPTVLFAIFPDYALYISIGYLVASLFVGITFNKKYITKGNEKIYNFKLNNLHASLEELKAMCANEGGTAFGNIFAGLATTTVLMFASNYILNNMFDISLWDSIFYNYSYEGVIIYNTDIDVENSFVITVPQNFKKDVTSGLFEYAYSKSKTKGDEQCKLTFNAIKSFRNEKRLINQMKEFYKKSHPTSVTEQENNGIKWYGFSLTDAFGKSYYYVTKYEDRVYLYTFKIMDQSSNECETFSKAILLSIKEKKAVLEEQKKKQSGQNNQTKQTEQTKKK